MSRVMVKLPNIYIRLISNDNKDAVLAYIGIELSECAGVMILISYVSARCSGPLNAHVLLQLESKSNSIVQTHEQSWFL